MHRHVSFFLSATLLLVAACTPVERIITRGDNAQAIGEYAEAAALYRRAYQQIPVQNRELRGRVSFKMGEAFRRYGNVARAVGCFQNAVRYKYTDTITYLRLGDMHRAMGDYASALKAYQAYLDSFPDNADALRGLQSCAAASALRKAGSAYTVSPAALFNSTRADYCPMLSPDGEQFYFSTTRRQALGDDLSGITAMKPGDIFSARKDEKGNWKRPEAIEGGLNTEYDEGACCFTPDGQKMYLTVCRTDAQYPRMAEIWQSSRSDASWSKPQQVKLTADTLSSYAHPAVSPDGRYLYFASDMPGGYGGFDLWRVLLDDHGVGAVENLGPQVNSAGNELFPSYRPNGDLYFASDGRVPNMGGLDLYCVKAASVVLDDVAAEADARRLTIAHLPPPMNSNGDDFGITFEGAANQGYFSSSRSTGGRGWDKIYHFSFPETTLTVRGWVYEQDGYELPAAQVYMVGSDGTNQKISLLPNGSFQQEVSPGVNYLFLATCNGYLNIRNQLRLDTLTAAHVEALAIERDALQRRLASRQAAGTATEEPAYTLQFPLPNIRIPVLVRGIHYEFDRATLTDSSQVALDRLVALLTENPHVTIELSSHCDYRGSDAYNDRLSQARAESVVRYLIDHGIDSGRLTAKGYGKRQPLTVSRRLGEAYPFLVVGDTLTQARIGELTPVQQETANALNRRTEFRVLRTTYGLFDEHGHLKPDAVRPKPTADPAADDDDLFYDE